MKCCICGKELVSNGNDPWPVNKEEGARCCDECFDTVVEEARFKELDTTNVNPSEE